MTAKKVLYWKRDTRCFVCGTDVWPVIRMDLHAMLIFGTSNVKMFGPAGKGSNGGIAGAKLSSGEVCRKCIEVAIGLEDHFDRFWPQVLGELDPVYRKVPKMGESDGITLVRRIVSDEGLLTRALSFRSRGQYVPPDLIHTAIGSKG